MEEVRSGRIDLLVKDLSERGGVQGKGWVPPARALPFTTNHLSSLPRRGLGYGPLKPCLFVSFLQFLLSISGLGL